MRKTLNIVHTYPQYFILPFFVGVMLFFISPDSYMFYPIGKCDSAVFYMSGKAMMNGMVPYVEFTDSKGVLLWLIYGIGYLLSNTDYTGLFWLEWFLYSVCYIYLYRFAYLFLNDKYKSFFICIFMTIFIFNTWCRNEVRAEDWCLPFVLMSIYYSCKAIYFNNKSLKAAFFATGLSIGACFMIKYSISVMLLSVLVYLIYFSIRNTKFFLSHLYALFMGMALILVPLFAYLYIVDAVHAFFNEYIINTFLTVSVNDNPLVAYFHEVMMVLSKPELCFLFAFSMWGCLSITKPYNKDRFFLAFILCAFWIIAINHCFYYYFSICTFFPVFALIFLFDTISIKIKKKFITYSILICSFVFITNIYSSFFDSRYIRPDYRIRQSGYYKEQTKFDSFISEYDHPKIFFYNCMDRGDGIARQALPASKYWFKQVGSTKKMNFDHLKTLKLRSADIVITESYDSIVMATQVNLIKRFGYEHRVNIKQYDMQGLRYRALLTKQTVSKEISSNIFQEKLGSMK